jgi:hypothetical protein
MNHGGAAGNDLNLTGALEDSRQQTKNNKATKKCNPTEIT